MEILGLYDEEGKTIDKTCLRGEKPTEGNIMIAIAIIKNKFGKYLIQKRAAVKDGLYGFTGGHVQYNENDKTAIQREVKEELGINFNIDDFKFLLLKKNKEKPCLISIFYLETDKDLKDMILQKEEVESVYYLDEDEIKTLIKEDKLLKTHQYVFELYKNYIKEKKLRKF